MLGNVWPLSSRAIVDWLVPIRAASSACERPARRRALSTLCGRRVEVNIKSRDLAVARDDEIHTGVRRRFPFRPRAPRQASRIVQNLGRAMRRINEMRMRRSEIELALQRAKEVA